MGKMLKHLGLRKCFICKHILNFDKFRKNELIVGSYICKECNKEKLEFVKIKYKGKKKKYRNKIIKKLGAKCNICGIKNENLSFFDLDHITPKRRKSKNNLTYTSIKEINNLQVLCPNCHRLKTIKEGWK